MKKVGKAFLWSSLGGLVFLLLTGELGLTILGIVLINYFEFRNF